jgi:UV DNA damage endonuclease
VLFFYFRVVNIGKVFMIRFGLCCVFSKEPIKFVQATARYAGSLPEEERLRYLSRLCLSNAVSLKAALHYCADHNIGDFRIKSQLLPLKTHPEIGYTVETLPAFEEIKTSFLACRSFSNRHDIRTTFHPDQFIFLNSPSPSVHESSISELKYQAEVSSWVGADVINIHGGGAYGDKAAALKALARNILTLPADVKERLTLENDDRTYTPSDLLPVCEQTGIPFVYDVHHHRCLPDGMSIGEATNRAMESWDREPLFHLSSPRGGWNAKNKRSHDDYIDIDDFPHEWLDLDVTVEVEAKAKELAVMRLMNELRECSNM